MPLENPLVFYTRHWGGQVVTYARILAMFAKIHLWMRGLERDPNAKNYTDEALSPPTTTTIRKCTSSLRRPGRRAQRRSASRSTRHARAHIAEPTVQTVK